MCDRIPVKRSALLIAFAAQAAAAQATVEQIARDARRAEARVGVALRREAALAERADSIARALRAVPESAVVRAGSVEIWVGGNARTPRHIELLAGIARQVWADIEEVAGTSAPEIAERNPLVWKLDSISRSPGMRPMYSTQIALATARGPAAYLADGADSAEILAGAQRLYSDIALARLTPQARNWVGGWMAFAPKSADTWERVAVTLATSPSSRARDCYGGALGECLAVLDRVQNPTKDWWHAWYRTPDFRDVVRGWSPRDVADSLTRDACVHRGDRQACAVAITRFAPPAPIPSVAVQAIVSLAVELGGRDAFARLTREHGSLRTALEVTSGVPYESLVSEWQKRAVAAKPSDPTPTPMQLGTIAFWAVALALVAGRRRPR